MAPIFSLILGKILDYLADHSDEIIDLIRKQFDSNKTRIHNAIEQLSLAPTEENLNKLHDVLEEEGEDTGQLAKILVNSATA